jgi:uncharacterized phage-associated protein
LYLVTFAIQITSREASILLDMTATDSGMTFKAWSGDDMTRVEGVGTNPSIVANNVLRRSFDDGVPVNLMKLQRLLYFTACTYMRQSGLRLLSEPFQAWGSGPVIVSLHQRLKGLNGRPITSYLSGPDGRTRIVQDRPGDDFRRSLNLVWDNLSRYSAADLSRFVKVEGSAWYDAWVNGNAYIDDMSMANDFTVFERLGLSI